MALPVQFKFFAGRVQFLVAYSSSPCPSRPAAFRVGGFGGFERYYFKKTGFDRKHYQKFLGINWATGQAYTL